MSLSNKATHIALFVACRMVSAMLCLVAMKKIMKDQEYKKNKFKNTHDVNGFLNQNSGARTLRNCVLRENRLYTHTPSISLTTKLVPANCNIIYVDFFVIQDLKLNEKPQKVLCFG